MMEFVFCARNYSGKRAGYKKYIHVADIEHV